MVLAKAHAYVANGLRQAIANATGRTKGDEDKVCSGETPSYELQVLRVIVRAMQAGKPAHVATYSLNTALRHVGMQICPLGAWESEAEIAFRVARTPEARARVRQALLEFTSALDDDRNVLEFPKRGGRTK